MQIGKSSTVLLLGLGLLSACATGPKRPLIDLGPPAVAQNKPPRVTSTTPPAGGGSVPLSAPARPLLAEPAAVGSPTATREEIDDLVRRLRESRGADRVRAVEQLVRLGALSPLDLEQAVTDARFEADLLTEAQARLEETRRPELPPGSSANPFDRKKPAAAPWIEEKYRLALDRYLVRDYLGCLGTIDAILSLEPSPTARPKLDRLRRRARERLVSETVIATSIVPESAQLDLQTPLRATVLLENKSHEPLVLRSGPGAPLGQVVLDYEELLPDGTRAMRRTTRAVQAGGDLNLAAGERLELKLDLPTEHAKKEPHVLGRYRLSGRLRPYTLLSGEEPLPYFLPLFETYVFVLDPEDRSATADPHAAFDEAVARARAATAEAEVAAASRRVFIAALVWAAGDRDAALAALVGALEPAQGELAKTIGAALGRALGEPGSYSKDEWLTWWRTSQSRPHAAHRAQDPQAPGGVPDEDDAPRDAPIRRR